MGEAVISSFIFSQPTKRCPRPYFSRTLGPTFGRSEGATFLPERALRVRRRDFFTPKSKSYDGLAGKIALRLETAAKWGVVALLPGFSPTTPTFGRSETRSVLCPAFVSAKAVPTFRDQVPRCVSVPCFQLEPLAKRSLPCDGVLGSIAWRGVLNQ